MNMDKIKRGGMMGARFDSKRKHHIFIRADRRRRFKLMDDVSWDLLFSDYPF